MNRRDALKSIGTLAGAAVISKILPACEVPTSSVAEALTGVTLPPPIVQVGTAASWGTGWSTVVAGRWTDATSDGLLLYNGSTGLADFYTTDGMGGLALLKQTTWATGWSTIVPGYYSSSNITNYEHFMGLAFYNASAGYVAIYNTDGVGNIGASPLYTLSTRTTWTKIVAGYFTPAMSTSLLFYDQTNGYAEIWKIDYVTRTRRLSLQLFASYNYWRASWTEIVAGRFQATTDTNGNSDKRHQILLYEGSTGYAELYHWDAHNALVMTQGYSGVLPAGAHLCAGNFGGSTSFSDVLVRGGAGNGASDLNVMRFEGDSNLTSSIAIPQSQSGLDPAAVIVAGDFAGDPEEHWFSTGPTFPNLSITEADRKTGVRAFRAAIGATCDLATWNPATGTGAFFQTQPTNELERTLTDSGPIWGYVTTSESNDTGSLVPGETLSLHVASSLTFSIGFYKITGEHVVDIAGTFPATSPSFSIYAYRDGAQLPVTTTFVIPATWTSNVYFARVTAGAVSHDIPFAVRSAVAGANARILAVIPDATYEAYNIWGGRCVYGRYVDGGSNVTAPGSGDGVSPWAFKVGFARPYLSIWGSAGIPDKWQEQELPFAQWLTTTNFGVDYCTNRDLDLSVPSSEYRLVVFIGHHEYWSLGMRNHISQFCAAGGNVAYLSGNTCWWQVRFDYANRQMICYKYGSFDPRVMDAPSTTTNNWIDQPVAWPSSGLSSAIPSSSTTGVGWAFDVTHPLAPDPYDSEIVYQPDATAVSTAHWIYENTAGLMSDQGWNGMTGFGLTPDDPWRTALSSECDVTDGNTPTNFVRLARGFRAPINQNPICVIDENTVCEIAVMGTFQPYANSSVFTASITRWCNGLVDPVPSAISKITQNVFTRFTNVAFGPNGATATLSPNTWLNSGGWSLASVLDGRRVSIPNISMGISSSGYADPYEPVDLILQLPSIKTFKNVVLYPRSDAGRLGQGFPLSFTIDVWDGTQWLTRVNIANYPMPTTNYGESFSWSGDTTDRIRIHATRLGLVTGYGYYLQYKAIEIY